MAEDAEDLPTFDAPSEFSDIVLVVEGRRFHVTKAILATWSPVFSKMFTSPFKERSSSQIPLPQKKACDILEMLHVLYPPEKPIDSNNVETILCMAREYQMETITKRCEKFLLTTELDLSTLTMADNFQLKDLLAASAKQLAKKSLVEQGVWRDPRFTELGVATRLAVVDERLQSVCKSGEIVQKLVEDLASAVSRVSKSLCVNHQQLRIAPFGMKNKLSRCFLLIQNVHACGNCQISDTIRGLITIASKLDPAGLSL